MQEEKWEAENSGWMDEEKQISKDLTEEDAEDIIAK
jgi:hypothetical protein